MDAAYWKQESFVFRRVLAILLLLLATFQLIAPHPVSADATYSLAGNIKISDALYGDPVAGSRVQLMNESDNSVIDEVNSNALGHYQLNSVQNGTYILHVIAPVTHELLDSYTRVDIFGDTFYNVVIHSTTPTTLRISGRITMNGLAPGQYFEGLNIDNVTHSAPANVDPETGNFDTALPFGGDFALSNNFSSGHGVAAKGMDQFTPRFATNIDVYKIFDINTLESTNPFTLHVVDQCGYAVPDADVSFESAAYVHVASGIIARIYHNPTGSGLVRTDLTGSVNTYRQLDQSGGIIRITKTLSGANAPSAGIEVPLYLIGAQDEYTAVLNLSPCIAPVVTPAFNPLPNANGWVNSAETITWSVTSPNPITQYADPVSIIVDGANQQVASTPICDYYNNCVVGRAVVSIDTTVPTVFDPVWSSNPTTANTGTTLSVTAFDALSGIEGGEYFIGADPGIGSGEPAEFDGVSKIQAPISTEYYQAGVYPVSIRARDLAGNWSDPVVDYLVVYDSGKAKLRGQSIGVIPVFGTDELPGLIQAGQTNRAKFGFLVQYKNNGTLDTTKSSATFSYKTGTKCGKPNANNCHILNFNSTSINWIVFDQEANSRGIFQGNTSLIVDGVATNNPYIIEGTDGSLRNPVTLDRFVIKIFAPGANPNSATPLYKLSADLMKGNIKAVPPLPSGPPPA